MIFHDEMDTDYPICVKCGAMVEESNISQPDGGIYHCGAYETRDGKCLKCNQLYTYNDCMGWFELTEDEV